MNIRRQEDLYHHRRSWLDTDWHFSFGEYHDPDNMGFGPLRVLNNDRVAGGGGFPTHSHDNMEIVTWIIDGTLVHEDSTGGKSSLGPREVQAMSAGTGIAHSEYNGSDDEPLHLIQTWIEPEERGIEPRYGEASYSRDDLSSGFVPVASGREDTGVSIVQDASILVWYPEGGQQVEPDRGPDRRGYVVTMTGSVSLDGSVLNEGDAAVLSDLEDLVFKSQDDSRVMLIDLPPGN